MLCLTSPSPSFHLPSLFWSLSLIVHLLSFPHPDSFDPGAEADADRGQAQGVFAEPGGDRPASPETRGGLVSRPSGGGSEREVAVCGK